MDTKEYIASGILELFVLDQLSKEESLQVQKAAEANPEIKKEILEISKALEGYAISNAMEPSSKIKPFLLATIDFIERMQNGESPSFPPTLTEKSRINEFEYWLNRNDLILPADAEDIYAKIIGQTPEQITAIVWIKDLAVEEVHHVEHEKFLIVEGTCNIYVEDKIYPLNPGSYFEIPLHKNHSIKVTSSIPCKVILQRTAA